MVAHAEKFKGVQFGRFDNYEDLTKSMSKHINKKNEELVYFCVGTDRSTGDSLAPFIGTMLIEKGYQNVIGTLDDPVHAVNLDEKIKLIPKGKTVLAFDACLGKMQNIGKFNFNNGSLEAGKGVGKTLTPIGDYHVTGTVNVTMESDNFNYMILQNTNLSRVLKMAKEIVKSIEVSFPITEIVQETNKEFKIKQIAQ